VTDQARRDAVIDHLRAKTDAEVRATKQRLIDMGMPLTAPEDEPKYWWREEDE
jgi:hypothetical protein